MGGIRFLLALVMAVVAVGCAAAPTGPTAGARRGGDRAAQPAPTKTITVGVTGAAQAMSVMGSSTTSGGWHSVNELHSAGLTTTDYRSRGLVGRLAVSVPTVENGGLSLLSDGRMRAQFQLRPGITWQDGK